jgi:two-component system chemotaxis sensor kinase CheA
MVAPLPRHMPRRATGSGREAHVDLDEEVREFLIECNENLANLDREVVLLEQNPTDAKLIASVFRTFHTIKGTCGFFGFTILGGVTHIAENILDQVRSNQRELTPALTSLILQTVDAIKALLAEVESQGNEGTNEYQELRNRLTDAFQYADAAAAEVKPEPELKLEAQSVPQAGATPPQPPELKTESKPQPKSKPKAKAKKTAAPESANLETAPAAAIPAESAPASAGPTLPAVPVVQVPLAAQALVAPQPKKAAESAAAGTEEGVHKNTALGDSTIRVDVGLLDKLMNLVGELVLARNQLLQGTSGHDAVLIRTVQRLNVITSELQEGVLKTRMQPIGVVWNKLPRVIRDLASECGKKIQIEMEGAETELDKTIIEAIKDPLTHIVRNSCDHGVEMPEVRLAKGKPAEGSVILRAYHEGGHVNIEISDDGGGLDPEKLKARAVQKGLIRADQAAAMTEHEAVHLVFMPGFSTAEQITKISGRGVGMDVVKTNIQKIGGIVDIYNRAPSGSTVKIKIPLTLAIIPGLIINARKAETPGEDPQEEHRFVIPQANLLELVRLERDADFKQIEYVNGTPVYRRRGQLLPLTYLNRVLGMATAVFPDSDVVNIVVLQAEDRPFGLVVDGIFDTQEIVVKPLGKRLKGLSSYLGATIMGDGRVALILDVQGLARLAGIVSQTRDNRKHDGGVGDGLTEKQQAFLVFQAGRFQRLAVPLVLVARLEQFPRRNIEFASGRPVLHYRGQILPLLALGHLLDASSPDLSTEAGGAESMQVIVFDDGNRRVGVVVDQIVDIIEETVTFSQSSSHPGLLGSAIVGGTITDLIDLNTLLRAVAQGGADADKKAPARLLVVDPSPIERTMLRGYLEMCGYHVTQACSFEESLELLPRLPQPDLVITAVELGEHTAAELLQVLRGIRGCAQLPIIVLASEGTAVCVAGSSGARPQFDAVAAPEDRAEVLRTIRAVLSRVPVSLDAFTAGQEPHHV